MENTTLIYISLYVLSIVFSISNAINKKFIIILWFFIMVLLSLALRMNLSGDLLSYSELMIETWPHQIEAEDYYANEIDYFKHYKKRFIYYFNLFPQYSREFIFWYSIRFLYWITNNVLAVFIILDSVIFIAIYRGFSLIRNGLFPAISDNNGGQYLLFGCMLFFPYVLGVELLYRQFFATVIALCAIGYAAKKQFGKGMLSFIIAIFIHNAILLLAPLFLYILNRYYSRHISLILLIVFPFLLTLMLSSDSAWLVRSSFEIGENIAFYHLVFFLLALITIFIIRQFNKNNVFEISTLISVLIYASIVFIVSSGVAERIALIIWTILYPMLAYYNDETFKNSRFMRLSFLHISMLPLLIHYNVLY